MSGELSLKDFIQKSDQPATDIQIWINTAFQAAIARILTVNDMYGDKPVREAVLKEINGLCRFTKKLALKCLSLSLKTEDLDE